MNRIPNQAKQALETLQNHGYEVYLVGGCVRDMLMGNAPHDWDITTNATPAGMQEVFKTAHTIETGLEYGTLTVIIDDLPLEITTYRIDGDYSDNRRPDSVTFTTSLKEDLARRDFTINAIVMDSNGKITDCYGGKQDIKNKIIKCVGEPKKRFNEDGLRILRALRFAAVLGFDIEEQTAKAIHNQKELLNNIAVERVKIEIEKLICGDNAANILREYVDVIGVIIPELLPMVGFEHHNKYHILDVWEHTLAVISELSPVEYLRWTALFHDIGKPSTFFMDENGVGHSYGHDKAGAEIADKIMERLKFDNDTRRDVYWLIYEHMGHFEPNKKAIKRFLMKHDEWFYLILLTFKKADSIDNPPEIREERLNKINECMNIAGRIVGRNECIKLKDLAVNGNDMLELGLSGKAIGDALQLLLEAVIDEEVENEKDVLIEYLKEAHNV